MNRAIILAITLILLSFVNSCSPVNILASGGATTMVVAEGDKSLGTVVDDATIKFNISRKFLSSENNLFINVDTSVVEGMVLLTGIVENQEIRVEAVKAVWEIEGIKEVINEIEVGNKTTIKEYANDVWITAQIKALATKDIGLRSISYNIETIRGKVYLAGLTSRPEQLETLINITKSVKGVKEVVNYVVIKE